MAAVAYEEEIYDPDFGKWWWVLLITGTAWLFLAMIMFRFDLSSVKSIGIMAGIVFICAAVFEFIMVATVRSGWWKALNAFLGVLLLVGGINAFARPGDAFIAIASITGFMFLLVGIKDLIIAFSDRTGLWWLRMISGFVEIGLAFWCSGEFGNKAVLLLTWVGLFALFRGIESFISAFQVRRYRKQVVTVYVFADREGPLGLLPVALSGRGHTVRMRCALSVLAAAISATVLLGVPVASSSGPERVMSVYDGDTLTLTDGQKVRLLQVDTPELGSGEASHARHIACSSRWCRRAPRSVSRPTPRSTVSTATAACCGTSSTAA